MHLILTFIFLGFSTYIDAKEINIHMGHLKYKITYTKDLVTYSGEQIDLSLKKRSCNEHIINKFNLLMNKMISEDLSQNNVKNSFLISIDNKKFYESKETVRGLFFRDFDKFFKQAKTEEFVNCQ